MVSEATSRRAPAVAAEESISVHDKGKRKIVDHMEVEKIYEFQEDPLVQKATMDIEAKRQQRNK